MKLVVIMVLALVLPLRADILVNGNFSDGRAHWKGDAQDADVADASNLLSGGSSNSGGAVIKLKKDSWRKIYQTFNVHDKKLFYSITFKLSDDFKMKGNDQSSPDIGDVPVIWGTWPMTERYWHLIVAGSNYTTYKELMPDSKKAGSQTLTGKLNELSDGDEAVFLLLIPPGEGTITLTNIALSPKDPDADP